MYKVLGWGCGGEPSFKKVSPARSPVNNYLLHIQIFSEFSVFFDEDAAGFDLIAHENCYAAVGFGEILDIDGDCGGFNLQWAWASGMLAGESCAMSLDPSARANAPARTALRPIEFHPGPSRKPVKDKPDGRPSRPHPENPRRDDRSAPPRHAQRNPKPASPSPKSSQPSKGMRKPHD
jgi:hypothetical protein